MPLVFSSVLSSTIVVTVATLLELAFRSTPLVKTTLLEILPSPSAPLLAPGLTPDWLASESSKWSRVITNQTSQNKMIRCTELSKRVGPRLLESRLLTPSGRREREHATDVPLFFPSPLDLKCGVLRTLEPAGEELW